MIREGTQAERQHGADRGRCLKGQQAAGQNRTGKTGEESTRHILGGQIAQQDGKTDQRQQCADRRETFQDPAEAVTERFHRSCEVFRLSHTHKSDHGKDQCFEDKRQEVGHSQFLLVSCLSCFSCLLQEKQITGIKQMGNTAADA